MTTTVSHVQHLAVLRAAQRSLDRALSKEMCMTAVSHAQHLAVVGRLRLALGDAAVSVEPSVLDAYSHDAWPVSVLAEQLGRHPHRPDVVVTATSKEQVLSALRIARETGTPLTPRGLGSSVTGQSLPTRGGIVLDLSGLVGEPILDETNLTVTAPAGVRGSDLEAWLRDRGYTHNFYPQSMARSSIGGWLATRATGQLSSKYGGIEHAAVGCLVALADGSEIQLGQRPRAAIGPDLREVFLGSEGMFGVILEVTLRIYRVAPAEISEAWTLPSLQAGIDALREIYQSGLRPSLMRLYDAAEARRALAGAAHGGAALFLCHDGLVPLAEAEHAESRRIVESRGGTSLGALPVETWLSGRFDFSDVESLLAEEGGYAETIEVAHLWTGLPALYESLIAALDPLADETYGHFSHVYTHGASVYVIVLGRAPSNEEAAARLTEIWRVAMETTTRLGGELSHHHGAGLARQDFIHGSLGNQHELIRRLKSALDPDGVLNPGHLGL